MAGEVTSHSVILQSRLTELNKVAGQELAGMEGVARFEVDASPDFSTPMTTKWLAATAAGDYVVKARVDGLEAGTLYHYQLVCGPSEARTERGPVRTFKTLPGAESATEASFVVVTGMNYFQFHDNPNRAYKGPDKDLGYPALVTILEMKPDFFVGTGDNVYYDHPHEPRALNAPEMRKKWHLQFQQPRYIDLWAEVPSYWEKDDHDYRYNDCDNTSDLEPSPELGASIFMEQLPIVDLEEPNPVTYRTHRVSRDLQIWLTEGRDHRSPNMMPSGPEKSLWGEEQREWLKRTLLESDAAFKILISAGPLIGPDDAKQAGKVYGDHRAL
jgi:alkaline phosphatase/alkaline phosphatase D